MKFLLDTMLGRLARHLRGLGYDTIIKRIGPGMTMEDWHRTMVSRKRSLQGHFQGIVILSSELFPEQMKELIEALHLAPDPGSFFSRCLICNTPLETPDEDSLRRHVPEYIQVRHTKEIRYCKACDKYYWPGTHRKNMEKRFKELGL